MVFENPALNIWLSKLPPEVLHHAELYLQKPVNRDAIELTRIWRALIKQLKYRDRSNGIKSCYYFESALMKIMSRPIGSFVATELLSCLLGKNIDVISTTGKLEVFDEDKCHQENYSINVPRGILYQPYCNLAINYGLDIRSAREGNSSLQLIGFIQPSFIGIAHELLHIIDFSRNHHTSSRLRIGDRLMREQWTNIEELDVINRMVGCENAISFFDYYSPIRISHHGHLLKIFNITKVHELKTVEYWIANAAAEFN
jgi:hypothetical protein